jgi:hypothetical protein
MLGRMRRLLALTVGGLVALAAATVPASPVGADPDNTHTLHFVMFCPGSSIEVVIEFSNTDAFHVVDTTEAFVWKRIEFTTPDGETGAIDRGIQGRGHDDLVICTYTGAASGNAYVVTGFFTG